MTFFTSPPQWVVMLFCVGGLAAVVDANANATDLIANPTLLAHVMLMVLLVVAPEAIGFGSPRKKQRIERSPTIARTRRNVRSIMRELGESYVRRSYRMKEASFWWLHELLKTKISELSSTATAHPASSIGTRNGLISTSLRLSAAIRYFAGGCPNDISVSHGISHSEVFKSLWLVVEARARPSSARRAPADSSEHREPQTPDEQYRHTNNDTINNRRYGS
jgi:hypothetical protein